MAKVTMTVHGAYSDDGPGVAIIAPVKGKVVVTLPWTEGSDDPKVYSQSSTIEYKAKKPGEILGHIKVPVKTVGPGYYDVTVEYADLQGNEGDDGPEDA